MTVITDATMQMLERSMDVTMRRQMLLTSNVANLDTPNFTPADVDFESALREARHTSQGAGMVRSNTRHLAGQTSEAADSGTIRYSPDVPAGRDGNSVDLDTQMSRLSQNAIFYQANSQAVSKKLAILKYAVTEGGH